MSFIGPIANNIIDRCFRELQKDDVKNKIFNNAIEPFLQEISCRYNHYFIIAIFCLFIIILLLVSILVLIIKKKHVIQN